MLKDPQASSHKAYSQTAKRRMRGCFKKSHTAATPSYNCPKPTATASQLYVEFYGLNAANTSCYFDSLVPTAAWDEYQGSYTVLAVDAATATAINGAGYTCTATPGYGRAGCSRAPIVSYSCQSGQTLSGTGASSVCTTPAPQPVPATPVFACLAGQTTITIGGTAACQTSVSTAAITTYSCPSGYGPQTTASGTVCMASSKLSTAAQATRYFQQDHLGSIAVITDEAGVVVERLSYDAWGKRRNANGLPDPADSLVGLTTDRGYTEHEHLDEVGVIHMNGRVYDPLVGRFMSADPFIQAPFELQSHNRYAYVMNNPLAYTDPSGYFSFGGLIKTAIVVYVAYQTGQWAQGWAYGAAAAYGPPTAAGVFWSGVAGGAAGGFAGGFTAASLGGASFNQSIDAGTKGGFSGALFGAAGGVGDPKDFARYAAHAGAGCVSSVASGGKCGTGAAAALAGKYITNETESWGRGVAQGMAASVAGGVGSVIAGGKFENGAVTAAFGYLYNACSKGGCWTTSKERAFLNKGDYAGYYKEACGSGDSFYACSAGDIAEGKSLPAIMTTTRLIDYASERGVLLTQEKLDEIRLKLAVGYANYLGDSADTGKIPSAMSIAKIHWDVFDTYNIPPRAFGGTPFGTWTPSGVWYTKQYPAFIGGGTGWCPKCAP